MMVIVVITMPFFDTLDTKVSSKSTICVGNGRRHAILCQTHMPKIRE